MGTGTITGVRARKGSVSFELEHDTQEAFTVCITFPGRNLWRLRTQTGTGACDNRGAVQVLQQTNAAEANLATACEDLTTDKQEKKAVIQNRQGGSRIDLYYNPFTMEISGPGEEVVSRITDIKKTEENEVTVLARLTAHESLYGTGERFDNAERRGKSVTIWSEDQWCRTQGNSYLPVPFVMSSRRYAFFLNRYEASAMDLASTDPHTLKLVQHDAPLDLYVCTGESPRHILEIFTGLWGRPAVPPEWGFGVLVSRHLRTGEFTDPAGIIEMTECMQEHDLPWSGVILEGWDTYDKDKYPVLKDLVEQLHSRGKNVLMYEACGRYKKEIIESEDVPKDFFVSDKQGNISIQEAPHYNPADGADRKESIFLDITNPEAVEWWQKEVWEPLVRDTGVHGAKIDFCEQFPEDDNITVHSGRSVKGLHHAYPVRYNIMMHTLFDTFHKDGGLCWSRGGSTGAHLYPFVWCGDQRREFGFLKAILSAILSSGMSGIPFMGHDLGGYMPAGNDDREEHVFVRGVELACFTAAMSTHGTVTRPYDFSPEIVDIYRLYSKIRYEIMFYILEQAGICRNTGLPLVRHLFLHYPDDEQVRACGDQFMFGRDIMAAPVLEDTAERDIYLPQGTWTEIISEKEYTGPKELHAHSAPLETIPLFLKHNATETGKRAAKIIRRMVAAHNSSSNGILTHDNDKNLWEPREAHVPPREQIREWDEQERQKVQRWQHNKKARIKRIIKISLISGVTAFVIGCFTLMDFDTRLFAVLIAAVIIAAVICIYELNHLISMVVFGLPIILITLLWIGTINPYTFFGWLLIIAEGAGISWWNSMHEPGE